MKWRQQLLIGVAAISMAPIATASEPLRRPGDCPFLRPMFKCPPKLAIEQVMPAKTVPDE